jgi:pilus assembly protein CpaC
MARFTTFKSGLAAAAMTAAIGTTALIGTLVGMPTAASAQATKDGKLLILSIGRGQQVNLGSNITDVVVADPTIADVEVKTGRQIYILGKGPGETTVYATDAAGRTVYQATVRVGNNMDSISQMLALAMPDSKIVVSTMNGVILLTGTVDQPEEAAEAEALVKAFTGGNTQVVSRLKNATPLQINLQVRIAEVSRSLMKEISGNLKTRDHGGTGILGGVYQGRDIADISSVTNADDLPLVDASSVFGLPTGAISLPFNPATGQFITSPYTQYKFKVPAGTNVLTAAGRLFGMDVAAAFDLSEKAGLSSTLANPNLTTVSGETAEFLAGGAFPVVTSSNNGTNVEYKNYGVNLTYTPTVLSDGRISLRVRSEVSDISSTGAVRFGGFEVPATTTRMAETTVELGSGQSMMIAGLLSNTMGSSVDKMPGAGDLPVFGALFKSNGWRRNETELMIVVTPYLVKPVSDSEIVLPTDGLHSPNDLERILLGKVTSNKGEKTRPMPTIAPTVSNGPALVSVTDAPAPLAKKVKSQTSATVPSGPGFSFDK